MSLSKSVRFQKYILLFIILLFFYNSNAQNIPDTAITETFELGEVTVVAPEEKNDLQNSVKREKIEMMQPRNASQTLDLLPGIAVSQAGGRNEAVVFIRGYDLRQIPVFVDGIPVSVPYDGYIDLNRLQVEQVSKITVDKGFASLLYGANTLGGAINIISAKPQNTFNLRANARSVFSQEGLNGFSNGISTGTRQKKWFVTGNIQWDHQKFYNLPSAFDTMTRENDHKRDNSDFNNIQYALKAGYTPNETDQYVVSFNGIQSDKGVPVYLGQNPDVRVRYWRYTQWDKNGLYMHSKTRLNKQITLKTRWYYDTYYNVLNSYDDEQYDAQTYGYAFTSIYDDKTYGGKADLSIRTFENHYLKTGVSTQLDHHQQYNKGETPRDFKDLTTSVAIEDTWSINRWQIMGGIGFLSRQGMAAEEYFSNADSIAGFPLSHDETLHYQTGIFYNAAEKHHISAKISRKSRFATLKDRYSYRTGRTIPNPDLNSETAWNTVAGYQGTSAGLQWSTEVYYNLISNTIQRVDNVQDELWQLQNTGKSHFRGIDVALQWSYKNFTAGANYSYIDQENISNPSLRFVDVPAHQINANIRLQKKDKYMAMLNSRYQSKRYSTSNGNYTAPAFITFDLHLQYYVFQSLKVSLSGKNLADKLYYLTEGYPEPGRHYEVKLSYNLSNKIKIINR